MNKAIISFGLCLLALQARVSAALPAYECHRTAGAITIDGKLDEADWQKVPSVDFYIPGTDEKLPGKTEGRLLWDGKYLYVGMKSYDKDIWSYLTQRDSATCTEDVLEVFVRPDPKSSPYYNFEINAIGTVYDAHDLTILSDMRDRWKKWNCKGLKVATGVVGTLNDPSDVDEYRTLEVAIPFSSLPGKTPGFGDEWTFQLAGYDYSIYLPGQEQLFASVPLTQVDFHLRDQWQPLRFVQ